LCINYDHDDIDAVRQPVRWAMRRKGSEVLSDLETGGEGFENVAIIDPSEPELQQQCGMSDIIVERHDSSHFDRWKMDLGTTLRAKTSLTTHHVHGLDKYMDDGFVYQFMLFGASDPKLPEDE
jgi:hypothetical protein